MKEIRLDFLSNPPLDREASSLLIPDFNFNSIAIKEQKLEVFRDKLKQRFSKQYALPFDFSIGGFLELLFNFKKIYYVASLHYEIRAAIELASKFIKIYNISLENLYSDLIKIDDELGDSGKLGDSDELGDSKDSVLIIAPLVNEDIFSINKIPNIKNATLALDISYASRLGLDIDTSNFDIAFINGATFGLPSGFGLIVSDKIYTSALYKKGVSEAFCKILDKKIITDSTNMQLFDKLKELLGDEVSLFAQDFAPNTLPLRLKHINTRNLIEHLYLDNIFLSGSQDCYLGFIRPSHTLIALGFGQLTSRELCAISFDKIEDISLAASKIAQSYKMIRLMEF